VVEFAGGMASEMTGMIHVRARGSIVRRRNAYGC
jgi:hypothetical protein